MSKNQHTHQAAELGHRAASYFGNCLPLGVSNPTLSPLAVGWSSLLLALCDTF